MRKDELVRAAARGDGKAFTLLLYLLGQELQNVIAGKFPRQLNARFGPDDVFQEALTRAWRNLPTFAGGTFAEFRTWLLTIGANTLHSMTRREKAQKRDAARSPQPHDSRSDFLSQLEEDKAESNSLPAWLLDAIDRLPESERVVVQRYWVAHGGEMPWRVVAHELDISCAAARQRYHRAIERLRSRLE